ncbi:MAG: hypothetical protein KF791_11980 [Verrucomicrobiae bacterium]|nr:hypothetical protein [Verrucomicrobiae bacterium]
MITATVARSAGVVVAVSVAVVAAASGAVVAAGGEPFDHDKTQCLET